MAYEILIFLAAELVIATYFSYKIEGMIREAQTLRYIVLLMIFTFVATFSVAFYNEPLFNFIRENPIAAPFAILVVFIVVFGVYFLGSKLGTWMKKLKKRNNL